MCTTCGCAQHASLRLTDPSTGSTEILRSDHGPHDHANRHEHHHDDHVHVEGKVVALQEAILGKNDRLAERNRIWLQERQVVALNLLSSPGSGKTTLLEKTILDLNGEIPIEVLEGDQETVNDAERIQKTGCRVVQINTGAGCHLEADMVARGMEQLAPPAYSLLMIENVGNLVCPALFDLGESAKVVILSVTEGEDKPLKYPYMFKAAQAMLLNKIDLLPYLRFDVERCIQYARTINPYLKIFLVSAMSGEGMQDWYEWLRRQIPMTS